MQLEAKEPIYRGFASGGSTFKYLVLVNPAIVADFETGGIDKADSRASPKLVTHVGTQG
jgi:hypothetical protein